MTLLTVSNAFSQTDYVYHNFEGCRKMIFTEASLNLPSGIKVTLEDRVKNVFTNLDDSDYKITLSEPIDGVGRFYLHTSSKSALSADDNIALSSVSIYKTNASNLRIAGLQQGSTNVKLYNILGKQVLNSSFEANGVKDVALPQLATGVYIVQL
ncbi:T9SS type A sorting domain-containing protein [Polaribacter sp.]|nr:T9SS type A sorting domain-containing protein [Polaribacter sp.]